jgi:prepilin-type N-terminal cleavage/methylation domain-containing protein
MTQHRRINHISSMRGFTAPELIAVIVILGTLAAVIMPMVLQASNSYTISSQQRSAVGGLNYALERTGRLFRGLSPAVDGTTDITTALPSQVVFGDGSGVQLIGTTLWYTAAGQTAQPLAQNISQFTISYLQEDGVTNSSALPSATQRVAIVIASAGVELRAAIFMSNSVVASDDDEDDND